jgi:hypothetical protein
MSFVCEKCKKVYKTKRGINNHTQKGCKITNKGRKKIYRCDLCNIDFEDNIELQRHNELDICSKFLRNNTYCYSCHKEFGTHELLIQHEFTDQHLDIIKQEYSNVTPLNDVKGQLKKILMEGTIKEEDIFPVTVQENIIQEELFEIEDTLRQHEKDLEKEEQKIIRQHEREIKKQQDKEKRKKELDKIIKKGIKIKSKKTKEDNSADISQFFQFGQKVEEKNISLSTKINTGKSNSGITIIKDIGHEPVNKINELINDKPIKKEKKKPKHLKKEFDKMFNYEFDSDNSSDDDEFIEINMDIKKKKDNKQVELKLNIEDNNIDDTSIDIDVIDEYNSEIKLEENDVKEIKLETNIIEENNKAKKGVLKRKKKLTKKDDENNKSNKENTVIDKLKNIKETEFEPILKTDNKINDSIESIVDKNEKHIVTKMKLKKNKEQQIIIEKIDEIPEQLENSSVSQQLENSQSENHLDYNHQIVQYNNNDRNEKRKEFYKKLRQKRDEDDLEPYIRNFVNNYNSVYNIKKYIGSNNINSVSLFQKLMNGQNRQLPYIHQVNEADKMNQKEFKNEINNIMNQRNNQDNTFQQSTVQNELPPSIKVQKTDRNTFSGDFNNIIKNRDSDLKDLLNNIPLQPGIVAPGMALPSRESEKISSTEFQNQMNKIMQDRGRDEKIIKNAIDNQKIDDKPHLQESNGNNDFLSSGNSGSSMDMNQYQKPQQNPQRNICDVLGMFDKQPKNQPKQQNNIIVEEPDDLERELQNVYKMENDNKPIKIIENFIDQKSALDNLLGKGSVLSSNQQQQKVNSNNIINNIDLSAIGADENEDEFDLGNELQQVSIQIKKEPTKEKNVDAQKEKENFEKFQQKADMNIKLMDARQKDNSINNPVWVVLQKIINESNIDKNFMNLLVNCRIEDYVVVHQFIMMSKQLNLEKEKKDNMVKIFQNYVKFLHKKKKKGEYIIQGKNVKYMLDVLKNLKL